MIQHKNLVKQIESMTISNEVSSSSEVEYIVNAVSQEVAFSCKVA